MSDEPKTAGFASSIFFTISIFIVFVLILLGINYFSQQVLKQKEIKSTYNIITSVIGTDFNNDPLLEKTIITSVDGKEKMELYPARQDGLVTSVVVKTRSDKGYNGYIELVVGFYMDGTISDYKILTHNETLGLGSKIADKEFIEQFQWFNPERQIFKVTKDGGDIDAVTSATISSRAVIDAIQKAYDAYKKFIVGE